MSASSQAVRGRLGWEILAALILKLLGLTALYILFFTPSLRPVTTDPGVAWHLFPTPPAVPAIAHDGDAR